MSLCRRIAGSLLLAGALLTGDPSAGSARITERLELSLTTPSARWAPGEAVPLSVGVAFPGEAQQVRVTVATSEGLSLLEGGGDGALSGGLWSGTLRLLPTSPG